MGKIYEIKINRFDGGISEDSREPKSNAGAMVKHFDIYSNPYKLIPKRSTVDDTIDSGTMATADIYHVRQASTGVVYGLAKNASGHPEIVSKATPQTTQWTLTDISLTLARVTGCFFEWQSAFWIFAGTNRVYQLTIPGLAATDKLTLGSTILTVAQGIVGGDNNAYMFYNNKVVRINSSSAATDAVGPSLPSDMRITCACLWNNYIAIGMAYGTTASTSVSGKSMVFIWDKVSTTTVSEVIDWGEGTLMCLQNVEGQLVGITDKYLSNSSGLGRGSVVIKTWNGGSPRTVKEIVGNQTVTLGRFLQESVVKNNKMYWVMSVPMNQSTATESTFHLGIWSYGRKSINSEFALSLEHIEESIDTSNYLISSFGSAGDYWFVNHSNVGTISRTDDGANYNFDSIYETQILDGGNASEQKKLTRAKVTFAPLPTAGSVTLKYRKDEETSWTTIFTHTTDNSLSHSSRNIESSGATLPVFKEIQFRVESTGGAEITGIRCEYEMLDNDI